MAGFPPLPRILGVDVQEGPLVELPSQGFGTTQSGQAREIERSILGVLPPCPPDEAPVCDAGAFSSCGDVSFPRFPEPGEFLRSG